MRKQTAFGMLTASVEVPLEDFSNKGAGVTDGEVYTELSTDLCQEEIKRTLEGGATESFGIAAA